MFRKSDWAADALLGVLRSPTRQSLRRSGYGSPAKEESRYGDGASDLSSEARSAKEEATKNLLRSNRLILTGVDPLYGRGDR